MLAGGDHTILMKKLEKKQTGLALKFGIVPNVNLTEEVWTNVALARAGALTGNKVQDGARACDNHRKYGLVMFFLRQ